VLTLKRARVSIQNGLNLGATPTAWQAPRLGVATTSEPVLGTHPKGRGGLGRIAALPALLGAEAPSGGRRLALHPQATPARARFSVNTP